MHNHSILKETSLPGYQQRLDETNRLFDSNVSRGMTERYARYRESTDIEPQTILYECDRGRAVEGSPFALFSYLMSKERYADYQHYWVISESLAETALPASLDADNVHLVTHESDEYLKALASCAYLINDTAFMPYFAKRDEQVYLNTWHGTPTASDNINHKDGAIRNANVMRNLLSADYLVADNKLTTSMYLDGFQLRGIYAGKILRKGCPGESDRACKAIVNTVFRKTSLPHLTLRRHHKKRLLICSGGINNNGISQSMQSLLHQIDYGRYDVTVFLNKGDADLAAYIASIPDQARVLVKVGRLLDTREEETLRELLDEQAPYTVNAENPDLDCSEIAYPHQVFAAEARRCFGISSFDIAIDFHGYERVNAHLALAANASQTCIWQHNDMFLEAQKVIDGKVKHRKSLGHLFTLYPRFDRIVSCSESISKTNRDNLATDETREKYVFARNCIDTRLIEERLQESPLTLGSEAYYVNHQDPSQVEAELIRLPSKNKTSFINVGRLSPEKNQEALIRAFARLQSECPSTELIVLGEGPLRKQLEALVDELDLDDSVRLPGNVANPLIFLRHADCFVFPSLYEGQGLALIEARLAGLPIIASRFDAVESVSIEGGQLLVDFDDASIYKGLKAFVAGKVPTATFSTEAYNQAAFAEFERAIG